MKGGDTYPSEFIECGVLPFHIAFLSVARRLLVFLLYFVKYYISFHLIEMELSNSLRLESCKQKNYMKYFVQFTLNGHLGYYSVRYCICWVWSGTFRSCLICLTNRIYDCKD